MSNWNWNWFFNFLQWFCSVLLASKKLISIVDVNWTCWLVWSLSETEQQSDNFPTSQLPGLNTGGSDDAEANKSSEISCWSGPAVIKVRCKIKRAPESTAGFFTISKISFKNSLSSEGHNLKIETKLERKYTYIGCNNSFHKVFNSSWTWTIFFYLS